MVIGWDIEERLLRSKAFWLSKPEYENGLELQLPEQLDESSVRVGSSAVGGDDRHVRASGICRRKRTLR